MIRCRDESNDSRKIGIWERFSPWLAGELGDERRCRKRKKSRKTRTMNLTMTLALRLWELSRRRTPPGAKTILGMAWVSRAASLPCSRPWRWSLGRNWRGKQQRAALQGNRGG
jgi:hypothetical protein